MQSVIENKGYDCYNRLVENMELEFFDKDKVLIEMGIL